MKSFNFFATLDFSRSVLKSVEKGSGLRALKEKEMQASKKICVGMVKSRY
jgi:hypothetical protein